jgi:hypothetical protein
MKMWERSGRIMDSYKTTPEMTAEPYVTQKIL